MSKFITNQNIELEYELASLGDRILAFLLDGLILLAFVLVTVALVGAADLGGSEYVVISLLTLPFVFYTLLFETLGSGQTPGKRARNIVVVKVNGGSPTFSNYLLRWLFRPVDILIYGSVAIVCILMTKHAQRLGDIVAGTTVAKKRSQLKIEDVKTIQRPDHQLVFPQVKRLNDKQIEVIRLVLRRKRDMYDQQSVEELAIKIKELLQVTTEMADIQFLYTVVKDYELLATRSIGDYQ